jgi:hypothetical protein
MGLNHIVLILLGLTALWFFIKQGMLVADLKAKIKARAESRSPLEKKLLEVARNNGGSLTMFEAQRFTGEEEGRLKEALDRLVQHHEAKKEFSSEERILYRITTLGQDA